MGWMGGCKILELQQHTVERIYIRLERRAGRAWRRGWFIDIAAVWGRKANVVDERDG